MSKLAKCVVDGCSTPLGKNIPMCTPHFDKLPQAIRHKYFTYRGLIVANARQDHPDFELWVERFEKSIADAEKFMEKL